MGLGGLSFGADESESEQKRKIWKPQANLLKDVYSGTQDLVAGSPYLDQALSSGEAAIPGMAGYGGQALPAWSNFLSGGTYGGQNFDLSGLNQMAQGQGESFDTYSALQNPMGNPYLDQMAGRGMNNLFQNYAQNYLPSVTNEAVASGGLGGSRQGIAQGVGYQGLMDSAGDYLTNLYGGQYQSDMNRALSAANAANQYQLGGLGQAAQVGQQADQTGLNALMQGQTAMNLGFTAPNMYNQLYNMQWQPYQQGAAVAGNPYTSEVSGSENNMSFGAGSKFAF